MLRFISIGSGSSGNCYILYTENEGLMIDCGVPVRKLKKYANDYGVNLSLVRHVLVTHDHADHVKSVGKVSEEWHVPVYTTAEVHQGISRNWCVRKKVDTAYQQLLNKDETVTLGCFKVTPFDVPHDSMDCVGYRVECAGVIFAIITDCGHLTEEVKGVIAQANYLVLEANYDKEMLEKGPYPPFLKTRIASGNGHMSNDACAQALAENATPALRHVWLCHLSEENNHPELARKTVETILGSYGIVAGKDFGLDVLKRLVPSGVFDLV